MIKGNDLSVEYQLEQRTDFINAHKYQYRFLVQSVIPNDINNKVLEGYVGIPFRFWVYPRFLKIWRSE